MKKEDVARVCHEANRAYSLTLGDDSHLPWDEAPQWQKDTTLRGVQFRLDDPTATAEDSHESWMKQKELEGWKYGPVKDVEAKEHPSFLPYDQLPAEQQAKDYLFIGIVESLASFIEE